MQGQFSLTIFMALLPVSQCPGEQHSQLLAGTGTQRQGHVISLISPPAPPDVLQLLGHLHVRGGCSPSSTNPPPPHGFTATASQDRASCLVCMTHNLPSCSKMYDYIWRYRQSARAQFNQQCRPFCISDLASSLLASLTISVSSANFTTDDLIFFQIIDKNVE